MQEIKIIQEPEKDKPFVVLYKPQGLASAPLTEDDTENALCKAIELFPVLKSVKGKKEIEYGLLHRIDTPTEGLLLIAATQEFYDFMQQEQQENRFLKEYRADCIIVPEENSLEGFPPSAKVIPKPGLKFTQVSFFRNYGIGNKSVRPVTEESGKAALKKLGKAKKYTTEVEILQVADRVVKVKCIIPQGYRHQVRCHLAWAGLPIIGDSLYTPEQHLTEEKLHFKASGMCFNNPVTGGVERFDLPR